jgi:preprotein translocase subunit SecY
MWMADQISSKGVGNGTSMIIFAGIIMEIPYQISQAYNNFVGVDATDGSAIFNGIIQFCIYLLGYVAIILFVMFTEKAERRMSMQHAQTSFQVRTNDVSYLPIKLNSAGVIPVIFASSLLTVPPIIMNFAGVSQSNPLYRILSLNTEYEGFYWGTCIYIFLIFVFTFFYTSLQLDAEKMATNFAKSGTYIPGVRPGKETEKYLRKVIFRVTTIGAFCLVFIAALPMFLQNVLELPSAISFGGTGLIVAVGVAAETAREINGRLASKDYQGFIA